MSEGWGGGQDTVPKGAPGRGSGHACGVARGLRPGCTSWWTAASCCPLDACGAEASLLAAAPGRVSAQVPLPLPSGSGGSRHPRWGLALSLPPNPFPFVPHSRSPKVLAHLTPFTSGPAPMGLWQVAGPGTEGSRGTGSTRVWTGQRGRPAPLLPGDQDTRIWGRNGQDQVWRQAAR